MSRQIAVAHSAKQSLRKLPAALGRLGNGRLSKLERVANGAVAGRMIRSGMFASHCVRTESSVDYIDSTQFFERHMIALPQGFAMGATPCASEIGLSRFKV